MDIQEAVILASRRDAPLPIAPHDLAPSRRRNGLRRPRPHVGARTHPTLHHLAVAPHHLAHDLVHRVADPAGIDAHPPALVIIGIQVAFAAGEDPELEAAIAALP